MSTEYYVSGDDVDFDTLNEQLIKSVYESRPVKTTDAIEVLEVSASQAYESYSRGSARIGVEGRGLTHEETPAEKILRMKKELSALESEMTEIIIKEGENKITNLEQEQKHLSEIKAMQENINNVLKNPDFKRLLDSSRVDDESKSTLFNITSQVREHQAEALIEKLQTLSNVPGDQPNVVFRLHLDKKSTEIKQEIKFDELDRRIKNMEKLLGTTSLQDDLVGRLNKVQKVMETLDEGNIESYGKRIHSVASDLDLLNARKQLLNVSEENIKKLDKLSETFKTIQPIGEEVHQIIDRLECLKLVHEESALINEKFKNLKDLETNLLVKLAENQEGLEKVSANFAKNVETINKNIRNLEDRVSKL